MEIGTRTTPQRSLFSRHISRCFLSVTEETLTPIFGMTWGVEEPDAMVSENRLSIATAGPSRFHDDCLL